MLAWDHDGEEDSHSSSSCSTRSLLVSGTTDVDVNDAAVRPLVWFVALSARQLVPPSSIRQLTGQLLFPCLDDYSLLLDRFRWRHLFRARLPSAPASNLET
jgi:hypothetical protein